MKTFAQLVADRDPEAVARNSTVCPCCGADKVTASLVCWKCFKHETPSGFAPLKWAGLPYAEWLTKARSTT